EPINPGMLPPAVREAGAPLRVLFIGNRSLGFKTTSALMETHAGERGDVDAVHWYPGSTLADRLLSAPTPLSRWNLDMRKLRAQLAAGRAVSRRLGAGGLDLSRFDVVHVLTQSPASFLPGFRRRGAGGCRWVVQADATMPLYQRCFGDARMLAGPSMRLERRIFAAADAVACWSAWTLESARDELGIDARKLFLYRPCPRVAPAVGRADAAGKLRIVFVGNDWERKGGPRLIRWHQERWVGRAEVHVCSAKAPVDNSLKDVVWHGPTPHAELVTRLLPSMHVMAMPTSVDTFVIAVAEGQIAGLPVVASRISGLQELVRDGVSGFLCDRDDDAGFIRAIERLIDDPALRARLAAGAMAHAARNLNSDVWHAHFFDQLHRVAAGLEPLLAPASVDREALGLGRSTARAGTETAA
ncbi:MAG: glycosyltransferase family 4 protein, partial [Phycisphaerales bacterium]|nr:glycosyltransferase family 4 protein [Phycisphaerales bacterium]